MHINPINEHIIMYRYSKFHNQIVYDILNHQIVHQLEREVLIDPLVCGVRTHSS